MEGEPILQTLAEVSVALAGFTGVVAVFGQRGRGQWSPLDLVRFRIMLVTSLAALLFSVLPFAFHHLGAGDEFTYASSSALLGTYLAIAVTFDLRKMRQLRVGRDSNYALWFAPLIAVPTVAAIGTQALNALGIVFEREFGAYLLGLMFLLFVCALMFIRLLSFVGREVRSQEPE